MPAQHEILSPHDWDKRASLFMQDYAPLTVYPDCKPYNEIGQLVKAVQRGRLWYKGQPSEIALSVVPEWNDNGTLPMKYGEIACIGTISVRKPIGEMAQEAALYHVGVPANTHSEAFIVDKLYETRDGEGDLRVQTGRLHVTNSQELTELSALIQGAHGLPAIAPPEF